jgi:hypothetical protein
VSVADEYRAKAAELAAKASREKKPQRRAELEALERSYLRLAVQAEKNAKTNLVYETPPPPTRPPSQPPVVQQQQQRQRKKKPKK